MFFRAAGAAATSDNQVQIRSGTTFCPQRDVASSDFTVYCTPAEQTSPEQTSPAAVFRVFADKVARDTTVPYYIAGEDAAGNPNAWTGAPTGPFSIACVLSNGVKSRVYNVRVECPDPTPADSGSDDTGCVVMQALDTTLSAGWTADHVDGVTFNARNRSKELTRAGLSPLLYSFVPPITARYAFVVDLTTRGRADFNDIYAQFTPGGWEARRGTNSTVLRGWVKGFQSQFTRGAWIATSVDHRPHSMSTNRVLDAGTEYVVQIAGRSNDVTVHRIIMFPCEGEGCDRKKWRSKQETCAPGSTMYTPRPKAI